MDIDEYARALRERLPENDVTVARTPAAERREMASSTVASGLDIDEEMVENACGLRLFAGVAAGYGHLPLDSLAEHNVAVTTASGVHGPNVAEHVVGSFLAFARRFFEARRRQRRHEWRGLRSPELNGSTVTVVGLGAIGHSIIERLAGFGVDTVGVRHSPEKDGPTDEVYGFDEIHEAVVDADYVALACPLTDETRHLVDREVLSTMPETSVLVNVARGAIVDTDALVTFLQTEQIRGAALDVTDPEPLPADHPLWSFENVFITPHSAGHTPQYYNRLADIVAENVQKAEKTGQWTDLRNQIVPNERRPS